jgi:hypothetical protein
MSIENTFGLEEDAPIFEELASGYLESGTVYEPRENLLEAFGIARRL